MARDEGEAALGDMAPRGAAVAPDLFVEVKAVAKSRGFSSANVFGRAAIVSELRARPTALDRAEENIAASVDRLAKEMRAFQNAQQALFALADSFVRLFLTCIPEPPAEMLEQAKARARLRYERLMLAAAQSTGSARRFARQAGRFHDVEAVSAPIVNCSQND